MNSNELKTFAEDFDKRRYALRDEARNKVREILEAVPGKQIVTDETLGYFLYENRGGEWVEGTVHAMRLDEHNRIQMTPDLDYDENSAPCVNDWEDDDHGMYFDENDDYVNINWPLVLVCTAAYLEGHPELLPEKKDENEQTPVNSYATYLTVRIYYESEKELDDDDVQELVSECDYSFESRTEGITITDTEIAEINEVEHHAAQKLYL